MRLIKEVFFMKKQILFLFLLPSMLLASCNRFYQEKNDSSQEQSSLTNQTKKLKIVSLPSKTTYYVYDNIDISGFEVAEETYLDGRLTDTKDIKDYVLKDDEGNIMDEDYFIPSSANSSMTIHVTKQGCTETTFDISVDEVTAFKESISITSNAKIIYASGEAFSSEGLEVELTASYRTTKRVTKKRKVTDYQLTLSKEGNDLGDPEGYVFEDLGSYTVTISHSGMEEELSTSYSVTVTDEETINHLVNLEGYGKDSSIDFKEDNKKMKVSFQNSNKETRTSDKGYYAATEVKNTYTISDYAKRNVYNWHYTPSLGEVPLLVIPVLTPGDEAKATSSNLSLIKKVFYGSSSDLDFESLRSYYYQSSYGKLDFKGAVTDYFNPADVDSTYGSISRYNANTIAKIPQMALDWAVRNYGIDPKDYDSDKDGCVDGIWLVYLHDYDMRNTNTFWAYTTSTGTVGTPDKPVCNTYAWASLSFIDGTFAKRMGDSSNTDIDAHVIIHETGHMLGLDDYYSNQGSGYNPLGNIDMMTKNIGDQNPFSKLLLGWITPTIVYDDCTISMPSSQSKDAVFVLPYDGKTYKKDSDGKVLFNAFDEYLVLDYYTPNNLNATDYLSYGVRHIGKEGARLYHVDNRLFKYTQSMTRYDISAYTDADEPFDDNNNDTLINLISNTETGSMAESGLLNGDTTYDACDKIRMISFDGRYLSDYNSAKDSSLFSIGSSFNIKDYSNQFNTSLKNGNTIYFNNQKEFHTSFTIDSIE